MLPIISLHELRQWCRIDDNAEDSTLYRLILTGQTLASQYTGLTLDPLDCPVPIKQAVAVFAADQYANREGQIVGMQTFEMLLAPYRTFT